MRYELPAAIWGIDRLFAFPTYNNNRRHGRAPTRLCGAPIVVRYRQICCLVALIAAARDLWWLLYRGFSRLDRVILRIGSDTLPSFRA